MSETKLNVDEAGVIIDALLQARLFDDRKASNMCFARHDGTEGVLFTPQGREVMLFTTRSKGKQLSDNPTISAYAKAMEAFNKNPGSEMGGAYSNDGEKAIYRIPLDVINLEELAQRVHFIESDRLRGKNKQTRGQVAR